MSNKQIKISPEVLAKIKTDLTGQKEKLENELNKVANKTTEHSAKFPEFGDKPDENAQEIEGYTTNLATKEMLESNLRDIKNSLKRIDEGTYGVCKYCGKEIGEKRLLVRPVASACVDCKTKLQNV
jgi:DnaK suppressor protein